MATQSYRIYTSEDTSFPVQLDSSRTIRLLVSEFVRQHRLPVYGDNGIPRTYALFSGADHRRLSSEQSLSQTIAAGGGDLYLADSNAPWWVATGASLPPAPVVTRSWRDLVRQPTAFMLLGGGALIVVLLIVLVRWRGEPVVPPITPTINIAVVILPTATLVPVSPAPPVTASVEQATSTIIIVPTEAIPTPAPVALQGVEGKYTYTGRVAEDSVGAFTRLRSEPDANSPSLGKLRNNDTVELIRNGSDDWVQVRVLGAADAALIGQSGWIKGWLIDEVDVPPRPTGVPTSAAPLSVARRFTAQVVTTYPGTQPSGEQASCVAGYVRLGGTPIAGAVVYANNGGPAAPSPRGITDGNGYYYICGLGDSTWSVVLTYIPGPDTLAAEVKPTVYVNGSHTQVAVVNFNGR